MERKYIVIPVNDALPKKTYFIRKGGELLEDFTAALDPVSPVFEAYIDVTRFPEGFTLTDENGDPVAYREETHFPTADEIPNGKFLRPAIHYTTTLGWTNDPNGLIFKDGTYHMFYQHNPMSHDWGNMTWGHAVSADLIRWTEVGDELFPDSFGTMYSGSAVCDENNVAGFGAGAILLFYTAAGKNSVLSKDAEFTQCLAYSTDSGKTFTKYAKNPILPHIVGANRDPKVQWSDELGKFTLSLYLDGNDYAIFTSDDLLNWTKLTEIRMPCNNECPDFYPLTTAGGETKWVFSGAHDTYIVGEIKDGTFVPEQEELPYHIGNGMSYAAQTFSGTPGRRIKIAWDRANAPGAVFNSQMGVPVEMSLLKLGDTYRLASMPVKELQAYRSRGIHRDSAVEFVCRLDEDCEPFTVSCFGMEIKVDPAAGTYSHGDCTAPLTYSGEQQMTVIFDTLGLEVFADAGMIYTTMAAVADRDKPFALTGVFRGNYVLNGLHF